MIKLSLKLDVSISKVALVIVGSAACYGLGNFLSSLVRSAPYVNDKDVSENFSIESKPDMDELIESSKEFSIGKNRIGKVDFSKEHNMMNKIFGKPSQAISVSKINEVEEALLGIQKSQNSNAVPEQSDGNVSNQNRVVAENEASSPNFQSETLENSELANQNQTEIHLESSNQTSKVFQETEVKEDSNADKNNVETPKCFLEDTGLLELLKRDRVVQISFYSLLKNLNVLLKDVIGKTSIEKLNDESSKNALNENINQFLKSLEKLANFANSVEDCKLCSDFLDGHLTLIKQVVTSVRSYSLMFNMNKEDSIKLKMYLIMQKKIYWYCESILNVLDGLLWLFNNLTSKPTKNELYNIIIEWNKYVGTYRGCYVEGLGLLTDFKNVAGSSELLESISKIFQLTENILTSFQDNLGSKIYVNSGKSTKKLHKIRTTFP